MGKKLKNTVVLAFLFSILIHASFWTSLDIFKTQPQTHPQPVEIVILDPNEAKKLKEEINTRIVEQDEKPINDEIPEDAFLSRFNQKVAKQTRAAKSGDFTNAAIPGQRASGQPDQPQENKPKKQAKSELGTLPSLKDLKPAYSLTPKADDAFETDQPGQQSQTNDYLKDLEKGPQTLLSTREFVYYSYYQRIREKIRQQWEPRIRAKVTKIFASGRSIASSRDRITRVIIVLNPGGSLIGVQVVGESGIHDLDDAAVEAFKAAEPFPNPPKGIIESDGTIKIRWDFVLEV